MPPIDLWHLAASILPHVENPLPESIGLGFPFTVSGAGSMLAGVINAETPQRQRERAMNRGGVYGFWIGGLLYALSLLTQVVSGL